MTVTGAHLGTRKLTPFLLMFSGQNYVLLLANLFLHIRVFPLQWPAMYQLHNDTGTQAHMQYLHIGSAMIFGIVQQCNFYCAFSFGKLRDIQINKQSFSCKILTIGFRSLLFVCCFLVCSTISWK